MIDFEVFTLTFIFILGLAIGSFLNVLIDRWVSGESILGRSYCDYCKKKIAWYDLIPILSFFLLRGKTRCCHKRISFYYPLVEFITGLAFVLTWMYLPIHTTMLVRSLYLVVISLLIIIFFSDLKYQIITDESQILLFIVTLLIYLLLPLTWREIGALILASIAVTLPILGLFVVTKGKGMGFGDVKLALNMGFLLGLKGGLLAIYIAFVLGASVGIILLILQKKRLKSQIAFGPFLVMGVISMMFFGDRIWQLFSHLYK